MMNKHGKHICNALKQVRIDIARANGINYAPRECHHEGDCAGTCPACESEMRYLEREIARRRSLGKSALVAGVSMGLSSLSAMASTSSPSVPMMSGDHPASQLSDTTEVFQVLGRINETVPQFPGGEAALMRYFHANFKYPPDTRTRHAPNLPPCAKRRAMLYYPRFSAKPNGRSKTRTANPKNNLRLAQSAGPSRASLTRLCEAFSIHEVKDMNRKSTTAGKTATKTNGGAQGAAKGNGKWRETRRKGERVLIDPAGRIIHGTAQEVREAALTPERRDALEILRLDGLVDVVRQRGAVTIDERAGHAVRDRLDSRRAGQRHAAGTHQKRIDEYALARN